MFFFLSVLKGLKYNCWKFGMRPDQLHVAQQIRRDKLRIQNQEFPNNNIEQLLSLHQTSQPAGFNNLDLLHLRNANNNMLDDHDQEGLYSSNQMINSFSTPSNPLHRNPLEYYYENHEINPNSFLPTSEIHNNDIFKSSTSISSHSTSEMASLMNHHGIWGGGNSNSPTVPVYHENQANLWTNRGVTVVDNSNMGSFFSDCNPQGLSLSLSSNSQSKPSASSSNFEQGSLNVVKPTTLISRDSTSSSSGFRNVGPLGPFTGYATILKNSRYLKPCQELLEECCCFVKSFENNNNNVPKWVSRDVVGCSSSGGVDEKGSSNSGGSSSMLYGSKEKENSGDGGIGNNFCLSSSTSSRPECQKNKAQLLYIHDEVCFLHCSCNPYSLFYFMYDFIYFFMFFLYVIVT